MSANNGLAQSVSPPLNELAQSLCEELSTRKWVPTELERAIAQRLVTASAGDTQLTALRLRCALWEGSLALPHASEGRLANLLAESLRAAESTAPDSWALTQVRELLSFVAD